MVTDYGSDIAGDLEAASFKMTCILEEGALTVADGKTGCGDVLCRQGNKYTTMEGNTGGNKSVYRLR
jgi:hypothetical protein